jgi:hypothetical protein
MPDGELVGVMIGSAGRLALVLGSYVCMSSAGRPDIIQCLVLDGLTPFSVPS